MIRWISTATVVAALVAVDVFATCGGGGGGGTGGMANGTTGSEVVYQVPWKNISLSDRVDPHGLVVYWFPASQIELERSSLRNSRTLTLMAAQCVTLGVSDVKTPLGEKVASGDTLPVAVLADDEGKIIGKALGGKDGKLRVEQVEKLLEAEVKAREKAAKDGLKDAKNKTKTDKDAAVLQLKGLVDLKCMFPNVAKDAANELKKLGISGQPLAAGPVFDLAKGAEIERTLKAGLMAENMDKYVEAEQSYLKARKMDPADPAPLRYLGELYRHQTGDWDKARRMFNTILAMPADPLSRAVALHGLGKMTIHDGNFAKGLKQMEDSIKAFPLALTYRNLAVYWHSEGDIQKSDVYTKKALDLDPQDPFNIVFAAAFMAGNGHADEALRVAATHEDLMCASYNLAAIHAQAGNKRKALDLLKRHFFEYERYDAVRSKEMMEARVDVVFKSLMKEPEFIAMTALADGKLPMR